MKEIFERRSIRKYQNKAVPAELAEKLLRAAMAAPSAGNQQPWEFVHVTERHVMDRIPEFHPYAAMCKTAPGAILVCGNTKREVHKDFWVLDCSAATENILLEAASLGLGTVWLGVYPRQDRMEGMRKLFKLPDNIIPLSLIPYGYPDETPADADRFDASRIHKNAW